MTTRLPRRVLATCAQGRREARIAVVCPPLVPAGGVVADPNVYGAETMDEAGDFYLLTFNNGDNRGYTHWICPPSVLSSPSHHAGPQTHRLTPVAVPPVRPAWRTA